MNEYEFELHFALPAHHPDPEEHLDALYEAGCDDALVGVGQPGYIGLDFSRQADSAVEAIRSAVKNVSKAIPEAVLISAGPDLVNLSDMSRVLGKRDVLNITRQAMRKYAYGETKKVARPFPPAQVFAGSPLWHMDDVLTWLLDNRKIDAPDHAKALLEATHSARELNASLEYARCGVRSFDDIVGA